MRGDFTSTVRDKFIKGKLRLIIQPFAFREEK